MTWAPYPRIQMPTDDEARRIVESIAQAEDGAELDIDAVRLLISQVRLAHQRCLSAWLLKYEPAYKAPRSTGPYAKWENTGRGNPGRFRDGSDIPKPPLVAIYFLCNAWWRREVGRAPPG